MGGTRGALAALLLGAAGAVVTVVATACGGGGSGARCGNGVVEGTEQCDDGMATIHCTLQCAKLTNDVQLRWTLIDREFPDFNESCPGVGGETAEFTFIGPGGAMRSETAPCSFSQTRFADFANGDWVVQGRLLDDADAPITSGQAMASFTVASADLDVTIDFPFADFTGDYTGNFFYRIKWAGADTCTGAEPPVVEHRLRIERDGVPFAGATTDSGDPADDTGTGTCRPFTGGSTQRISQLAWGPAQFTITGLDATGTPQFRESFDTFIGAGIQNPEYVFDVNSLAPDAGVPDASPPDAMPDAGAPDAGPPDAGTPDAAVPDGALPDAPT